MPRWPPWWRVANTMSGSLHLAIAAFVFLLLLVGLLLTVVEFRGIRRRG